MMVSPWVITSYPLSLMILPLLCPISRLTLTCLIDTAPGSPATSSPVKPVSAEGMESTQSPQSIVNAVLAF